MTSKQGLKSGISSTRWTFRIFFIFSARGNGKGSPRRWEGGRGDDFLLKIPGGGGLPAGWGRGGARDWEGVCREFGGRGAKYFFRGRAEIPAKDILINQQGHEQAVFRGEGQRVSKKWRNLSGTRSTKTRNRNLQFRGAVSTGFCFYIFSSGFFLFLPVFCAIQSGHRPKVW